MIICLTGTPGTGKSTVSKAFAMKSGYEIIDLNELLDENIIVGYNEERQTKEVDLERLSVKVKTLIDTKRNTIIDGHLSHLLGLECTIAVLRASPEELEKRLGGRGYSREKIEENVEAEVLDVCLIESVETENPVFEIDTTKKNPEETISNLELITCGKGEDFLPGKIDWTYYLL